MLPDTLLQTCKAKEHQTIRQHTDLVKDAAQHLIEMGCVPSSRIGTLLLIACEFHDYGKVNEEFQKRIKKKYRFQESKEVAHNILSYFFLDRKDFDSKEDYQIVAAAVLYHHAHGDITYTLRNKGQLIDQLLRPFQEYVKTKKKVATCYDILSHRNPDAILVKGLLHRCDYSASAGIPCELPHDFLETDMEGLLQRWRNKNPQAAWNDLQQFCSRHREDNILVTAPTGMGKTEAALLWLGNQKGFFVLPLRTAINAMYERIGSEIISGNKGECLALLHSDTMSIYRKEYEAEPSDEQDKLLEYYTRSRQMALPLTICTLDQLFNFVYKYPGYEYKLATLSYSKIMIDEIQMYDPELLAYLVFGIAWMKEMGGKIAVLTATMPPFARKKLEEALDGEFVEADFSHQGVDRHNVKVIDTALNAEDIREFGEKLKTGELSGSTILVVCNSIEIAQQIYQQLKDSFEAEISLLHSNFTRLDRAEKERQILADGKSGAEDEGLKIWIATSVVEASLDIDFDYLFTELNDLFSLFQRFGRCNRKGKKPTDSYNCFVYLQKQGAAMRYVDETIYQCSRNALLSVDGLLTEQEKTAMIEEALSAENLEDSEYSTKYKTIYEYIYDLVVGEKTEKESQLRNILSEAVLPSSVYEAYRDEIEKMEERLGQENVPLAERIKARDTIYQHTVSIPRYRYEKLGTPERKLKLGRREVIPIVDCDYDREKGLVIETMKKAAETTGKKIGSLFI